MKTSKYLAINTAFFRVQERIRNNIVIYPFVLIVSFSIVLILTTYVLNGLNHRAGNPSNPIDYQTTPLPDVPLWFSVTPIGDEIVLTTSKGKVFRWPQKINDLKKLSDFVSEVRNMSSLEIKSAALLNKSYPYQGTAIISADRQLTYAHLKPIIFALAEAGISNYAIETKLTEVGEM